MMSSNEAFRSGRHFLQIPGPSNLPDRVLRAIDRPTMDHRGPEFGRLGRRVLGGLKRVFGMDIEQRTCCGKLMLIAITEEPAVIDKLL